jgi:D-3-phosphoglycerate dehydrogenase
MLARIKIIGRGGVGMDNIDVDYAKSKGIPRDQHSASSSESVAELVLLIYFLACVSCTIQINMPLRFKL